MRSKLTAIVAGAMMVGSVNAQDVKLTPTLDVSYMHSDAQALTTDGETNQGLQSPNSRSDMDVQYAGLAFSGTSKSLNWFISADFAGDASNNSVFIDQAYLSQSINDNFSIMAGRFYTFVGYENILSKDNWNYTKSIAKALSPIYHEGVSASFDGKNGFAASLYFVDGNPNSEDNSVTTTSPSNSTKNGVGATASYAMDKLMVEADYFQYDDRSTLEATKYMALSAKYDVNDQFTAALAVNMGESEATTAGAEQKYSSYAAYLKFKATEKFFAALRYEMFKEEADTAGDFWYSNISNFGGYTAAAGDTENDINSITLTAGYDLMNGSELKLEYRMDSSDKKIYSQTDGVEDDSNNTVALAWLFSY